MKQIFTIVDNKILREMTEKEIEYYSSLEETDDSEF